MILSKKFNIKLSKVLNNNLLNKILLILLKKIPKIELFQS